MNLLSLSSGMIGGIIAIVVAAILLFILIIAMLDRKSVV